MLGITDRELQQEMRGGVDALARILGMLARHQGIDRDDLSALSVPADFLHPEHEGRRRDAYEDTIAVFIDQLRK